MSKAFVNRKKITSVSWGTQLNWETIKYQLMAYLWLQNSGSFWKDLKLYQSIDILQSFHFNFTWQISASYITSSNIVNAEKHLQNTSLYTSSPGRWDHPQKPIKMITTSFTMMAYKATAGSHNRLITGAAVSFYGTSNRSYILTSPDLHILIYIIVFSLWHISFMG